MPSTETLIGWVLTLVGAFVLLDFFLKIREPLGYWKHRNLMISTYYLLKTEDFRCETKEKKRGD
jgi:hypothetical protein